MLDHGQAYVIGHDTWWQTYVAYYMSHVSYTLTLFSLFSDNRTEG